MLRARLSRASTRAFLTLTKNTTTTAPSFTTFWPNQIFPRTFPAAGPDAAAKKGVSPAAARSANGTMVPMIPGADGTDNVPWEEPDTM